MTVLAVETGVPMSDWLDAGERAIATAIELLVERSKGGAT